MSTRVEKINQIIELLHLQKQMGARQIYEFLRKRGLDIDIEVVVQQILPLVARMPVVGKKNPHKNEERNQQLLPLIEKLQDQLAEMGGPLAWIVRVLQEHNVPTPKGDSDWSVSKLRKYLIRHKRHKRSTFKTPTGLTFAEFDVNIKEIKESLHAYSVWARGVRLLAIDSGPLADSP